MTNDVYNAAVKFTNEYKWVVHPLSPPTDKKSAPGKRPLIPKWSNLKEPLTEQQLQAQFKNKNVNIGVVCGAASNLTIIDIDDGLFLPDLMNGVDETDFIMSNRIKGRGHLFFKHCDESWLRNYEYDHIKIDVRNDNEKGGGGNIVLPPSTHLSGDVYKFNKPDFTRADIPDVPEQLKTNFKKLIKLNSDLSAAAKKSRKWVREFLSSPEVLHGRDGRRCMLALCAELKANGFTSPEHGTFISRIVYRGDYDSTVSNDQWGYVEPFPWKSSKLIAEFPEFCNEKNTHGDVVEPVHTPPDTQPQKPTKTKTFVVLDEKRFDGLLLVFGGGCKTIKRDGQTFYECADETFIKSGEMNGVIRTVNIGSAAATRITSVAELYSVITKMEIKSGKHTLYYVYIDEKQLCFSDKDLLNIAKWREQLVSTCKIVMGLRGKQTRDEFDEMVVDLLNNAETVWNDAESEDEMLASLVYEDLCSLIKVDNRQSFKRNDMSYLIEDDYKMVKSSTIYQIIKNKNIGVPIQQIREILRPLLFKNSEQVRIDGDKISVWYFKVEESKYV